MWRSKTPFMAQTAAIEAERHINAYATLRIRLPPWVFDVEAHARPWVKDTRLGEPVVRQLADPIPGHPILLAASPERPPPQVGDVVTERRRCPRIRRHGVISKEPGNDLPYRRFTPALANRHARLGADVVRYSFIVSDLHRLSLPVSRRTVTKSNYHAAPHFRMLSLASILSEAASPSSTCAFINAHFLSLMDSPRFSSLQTQYS